MKVLAAEHGAKLAQELLVTVPSIIQSWTMLATDLTKHYFAQNDFTDAASQELLQSLAHAEAVSDLAVSLLRSYPGLLAQLPAEGGDALISAYGDMDRLVCWMLSIAEEENEAQASTVSEDVEMTSNDATDSTAAPSEANTGNSSSYITGKGKKR